MDSVVLGTSLPSWSFGSHTYKMKFIIQQFAHVVETSAKCLTQGLEDSNFSLPGQKWCVWGAGQSSLSLGVVCPGLPVAVLHPAVSFPSTGQRLLTAWFRSGAPGEQTLMELGKLVFLSF